MKKKVLDSLKEYTRVYPHCFIWGTSLVELFDVVFMGKHPIALLFLMVIWVIPCAIVRFARIRKIETPVEQPKNNSGLPDGLQWPKDSKWKWFAADGNGECFFYSATPYIVENLQYWGVYGLDGQLMYVGIYPILTTNWHNSLVKRPD